MLCKAQSAAVVGLRRAFATQQNAQVRKFLRREEWFSVSHNTHPVAGWVHPFSKIPKSTAMAVTVETLEKLERKITLSLPAQTIQSEVQTRLQKLGRNAKLDGFRPGKVPLRILTQRYGPSVEHEVLQEKLADAFNEAANEAQLRVIGQPHITEKEIAAEGQMEFDAVFEVYPDNIQLGDLATLEVEKITTEITEAAIERTIDILRKQKRTFEERSAGEAVQEGDRVTVDFEGKIEGEAFAGGKAEDFQFLVGEKQMLPEFEAAARGMKAGESKTFPLTFPENYNGKEVAGKTADFLITVKKTEAAHLPEVNEAFIQSLNIAGGTVEALRADVRKNLEREMASRLLERNRAAVLEKLVAQAEMDIPQAAVQAEMTLLARQTIDELVQRGADAKNMANLRLPKEIFQTQAEKNVRTQLVLGELLRLHPELEPTEAQIQAHVQELVSSYEQPQEVEQWLYTQKERMDGIKYALLGKNVMEFVWSKAKVLEKALDFDEIMAA